MSQSSSLKRRVWIIAPLLALGFLYWSNSQRVQRVLYVTNVVAGEAVISPNSPTGYAGEIRNLIVPEQNYESCRWISQTQQMLAQNEWRVRGINYENAPLGREVLTPSPYRWWLAFVAWLDHTMSGRSLGLAVERAALLADPALQALLLIVAVVVTVWRFGAGAAVLVSLGVAGIFPFAAGYLPGVPDDRTLSRACAFLSVLVLLAGTRTARPVALAHNHLAPRPQGKRWFFAAGIIGGFGLWISVADQMPVILGVGLGALFASWICRRQGGVDGAWTLTPAHWLVWSVGGAASSLVFYLIEYFPGYLGEWHLRQIHPVYGIAWLGLGVALNLLTGLMGGGRSIRNWNFGLSAVMAVAGLAVLPVLIWKTGDAGFLAVDSALLRLTRLPGSAEAASLVAWLHHDGFSAAFFATVLPALLITPACWMIMRGKTQVASTAVIALAMGPVLVALGFACWQIGRWSNFDLALLAMVIAVSAKLREPGANRFAPWIWSGVFALAITPGIFQLGLSGKSADQTPLNESELASLIARDLAHWLAKHVDTSKALVLAPPNETTALYYYGGVRGLGTLSPENQVGAGAAARIFSATTPIEASVRVQRREVTHIIVPSWDRFLNEYVQLSSVNVDDSFLSGLRNWAPIPWLRPIPYQLPAVSGYEDQSVAVFEVVDEQKEATILSWQAEYFAESGRLDYAGALSQALLRFPSDLGSVIARGQVAMARRDGSALDEVVKVLLPRLKAGADRYLPWDRRVGLAAVLAQAKQNDLAREQIRLCLAEVNEKRVRSASTATLYRLLVLTKLYGLEMSDPSLRALAIDLLPVDWRNRI